MNKYEKNQKKKKMTIWTVVVALVIIFVVLLAGVFFLRFGNHLQLNKIKLNKVSLDQSLSSQLDNQKGEGAIQVRLTDSDVDKLLNTNAPDFPLKNPSAKITSDQIVLSGKTSDSPLSFKVQVGIIPKVNNGKIDFEIRDIKTAGVTAPKLVTDQVNEKLSNYLKQFSLGDNVKVTDVKMYDGYLIANGERL